MPAERRPSDEESAMNIAVLRGTLSSDPVERTLPSGTRLVNYEVTTPDAAGGPAHSAPVAWFDPPARLPTVGQGDEVVVVGQVHRRFFRTAGGVTASRTEVVADRVVSARPASRVERLLADAAANLQLPDT
jgi:single-strand DNA-binding protein